MMARQEEDPNFDHQTAIRLTRTQRLWLDKEGQRSDRSLSWLIRQAVDLLMESKNQKASDDRRRG